MHTFLMRHVSLIFESFNVIERYFQFETRFSGALRLLLTVNRPGHEASLCALQDAVELLILKLSCGVSDYKQGSYEWVRVLFVSLTQVV